MPSGIELNEVRGLARTFADEIHLVCAIKVIPRRAANLVTLRVVSITIEAIEIWMGAFCGG